MSMNPSGCPDSLLIVLLFATIGDRTIPPCKAHSAGVESKSKWSRERSFGDALIQSIA